MSFANYDYEAQAPAPKKGAPSPESSDLDEIIKNSSDQIETYGQLITQFNTQRKLVGSKRDGLPLRDKLNDLQKQIAKLGSAIGKLMENLNSVVNSNSGSNGELAVSNRQIMLKERLVAEFSDLYGNFQTYVRLYQEKKSAHPIKATVPADEATPLMKKPSPSSEQIQIQEDLIQETELHYHTLLTEERNREISQVAEGIREVNSIFKDLGELVNQQGEQLDTVEDNILQMHGNTQQASRELTKAHEYQKKRGKWSCIILVALCIFVLVIVLAVMS